MSFTWIYVISHVCLAGRLAVLHGKNFNVGHYTHVFQLNSVIPAMLLGTIGFYNFILHLVFFFVLCVPRYVSGVYHFGWDFCIFNTILLVTLILMGVARSAESKTCLLHFFHTLWSDQDKIWRFEEIQANILILLLSKIFVIKGTKIVLLSVSKNLSADMQSDIYETTGFKLVLIIDTVELDTLTLI